MNYLRDGGAPAEVRLRDKLFALLLYLLPHHLLSQAMRWLTRLEWRPLKERMIDGVIRHYKIDMSQAEQPDPKKYPTFNAFFTRSLRPEARPLAAEADAVASPVDGTVSQLGRIENGRIFQAKGHSYNLADLLGNEATWCQRFEEGHFITIYLAPSDYHRIHMPLSAHLRQMRHIPGRLFSVNPATTRTVPRLFSRNERLVNLFDTASGPMAVVMVGAIFVGSMDTVWSGTVTPVSRRISHWSYGEQQLPEPLELEKGAEMGRFNMGSTVILLFPKDTIEWSTELAAESKVTMGSRIATLTGQAAQARDSGKASN